MVSKSTTSLLVILGKHYRLTLYLLLHCKQYLATNASLIYYTLIALTVFLSTVHAEFNKETYLCNIVI